MIEVLKQALEALEDVGVLTDREWQAVHKNKANELRQAIAELESQEPVGWHLIEALYPKGKRLDIRMGDGSILCNVLPQADGDLWWDGSGTGEKFIDPVYADVTHWRIHSKIHPSQRTEQEPVVEMKALADNDSAYAYADGWNACVRKFKATHPPQRTESEPVAYINVEMRRLEFAHDYVKWDTPTTIKLDKIPLYTHLPQRTWVGLTNEEIASVGYSKNPLDGIRSFARAIEAKLKEKNNA